MLIAAKEFIDEHGEDGLMDDLLTGRVVTPLLAGATHIEGSA
jgi:hypothetical protein